MENNEIRIVRTLITPAIAKEYLKRNTSNRPLSKRRVSEYAGVMKKGGWREDTLEIIKFDKTSRLIDGQHRLEAIVLSGASVCMHVAFGLTSSVFDVLDTGKGRGSSDVLAMHGVPNHVIVSSMIKALRLFKAGRRFNGATNVGNTNKEILEDYKLRSAFYDSIAAAASKYRRVGGNILESGTTGMLLALFTEKNPEQAKCFFDQLFSIVPNRHTSVLTLHNILLKDRLSLKSKMDTTHKYAIIIKAWNAFILNKEVNILRFSPNAAEKFPTII